MFRHVALISLLAATLFGAANASDASRPDEVVGDDDQWIVVLTDTRASRRKGWSSGVGYSGSYNYASDPILRRLARSVARRPAATSGWPIAS